MAENGQARENGDLRQQAVQGQEPPETVEQDLVDKTTESGAAAYQFNPDASPEEKAAAAESVCSLPCDWLARLIS